MGSDAYHVFKNLCIEQERNYSEGPRVPEEPSSLKMKLRSSRPKPKSVHKVLDANINKSDDEQFISAFAT